MARLTSEDFEKRKAVINLAALTCFTKSGYNGVTMRDIAQQAKIPLGSLYNYYEDKLTLFKEIVNEQSGQFLSIDNDVIKYLLNSQFPDDLPVLAEAIRKSVVRYESYFKLMYIDVVEFDGEHIKEVFSDLDEKFKSVMEQRFRTVGLLGPGKIDPVFAFISIYLSFYQYFILSKLFGATKIFGKMSDRQVVDGLIEVLKNGIGRGAA
ncbi:MAG: TetR/AcrR family transcriptional regulator [Bdellovibrionota bacterium]